MRSGSAVPSIDYAELKKTFKKIFDNEIYKKIQEDPELKESNFPENFSNVLLIFDIRTIVSQLAYYFETYSKNFKYTTAADKKFQNLLKALIKSPEELKKFIAVVEIDFKEFIKILSFSLPSVFTPNLIKFIKENYLSKKQVLAEKLRKTKK